MKDTRLGEFEEVILLIVGILGEEAYALRIAEEFKNQSGRSTSIGAVHSTLERLIKKGFLTSETGAPSAERGGRRKRIYSISGSGQEALQSSRDLRISLWNQFPGLSTDRLKMVFPWLA